MEAFPQIKKDVAEYIRKKGNEELAKKVPNIYNMYLRMIFEALIHKGKYILRQKKIKIYVHIKPVEYLNATMYRNMLISRLNPNYIFEIKMDWKTVRNNKFKFRSMKKLKYHFKKECLDTYKVHKLIQDYEKSIL